MAALNALIALLTVAGMTAIAWGYRAALRERGTVTWYFAASMGLLALSMGLRRVYWDVLWTLAREYAPATAASWSALATRHEVNLCFNLLILAAVYCGLKARQLLLPPEEQTRWPWWRAWAHPSLLWWR